MSAADISAETEMRDISDNTYIKNFCGYCRDYTANGYLFNEYVSVKTVDYTQAFASIFSLMAILRFDIRLSGSKFMSKLVADYLFDPEFDMPSAIKAVANGSAMSETYVTACINESLCTNAEFISTASKLFNFEIHNDFPPSIDDAIQIIAALAKVYFNHDITGSYDSFDSATIRSNRIFS